MIRERLRPEVIGQPECPLLHRWTLYGGRHVKLLLHHFLPESRERDAHDHPRPFWTLVLVGEYVDESRRPASLLGDNGEVLAKPCGELVHRERMRAGTLRFRPASYTHRTWAGPRGAWTVVLMGPLRRPWGFLREGRWWPWRVYEERFGHGFRCE